MSSRTVLITGCASGIGNAAAQAFRERDWDVYATDPDPKSMTELERLGCETLELDVTKDGDAEAVVDQIEDEQGRIDLLFNNAGYGQLGPVEELSTDLVRDQFEVNVFGQHRLVRAVLPVMRRREEGTIVNMSSIYGRTVFPGYSAYCGSKWAVEAMSATLRSEVSDYGIDVVVLEPGPVETEFGERALEEIEKLDRTGAYEWFYRMYDDRQYIDKAVGYVQPEDVADVVVRIADDDEPDRRYAVGPWKYRVMAGSVAPNAVRETVRDTLNGLIKKRS